MSETACMGGWCKRRGQCPNYHAKDRSDPVERLCGPQDGVIVVTATPWQTVERDIFAQQRKAA